MPPVSAEEVFRISGADELAHRQFSTLLSPVLENFGIGAILYHAAQRLLHRILQIRVVFAHHDPLWGGCNGNWALLDLAGVFRDVVACYRRILIGGIGAVIEQLKYNVIL